MISVGKAKTVTFVRQASTRTRIASASSNLLEICHWDKIDINVDIIYMRYMLHEKKIGTGTFDHLRFEAVGTCDRHTSL